jgi:hypothetical protein
MPPADRTEEARKRKRQEYLALNPPPKRRPEPLKIRLIRGFLVYGIGKPILWTYKIIFGWWLNPLIAGRGERKFRKEVRAAFSFLFDEYGAQFVPYSEKSLYWSRATFTVRGLLFRVSRARGDCSATVAPVQAPTSWESLYTVIHAIDANKTAETKVNAPRAPLILGLSDIARWVESRFSEIEEAFSPAHYARTVEAIEQVEEIDRQKAEKSMAEWNERAKFYREHPEASLSNKKQSGPIQSLGFKDL